MNSNAGHNYLVICPSRSATPWLLSRRLRTRIIGKRIYFYRTISSTQKLALSLVEKKTEDIDGTVIICERQTDGIGRAGKRWISPTGGIWMSVILKPNVPSSQSLLIMFLATLTVCEVIKSETGLNPKIKWPNDVIISGKKVCGTLVNLGVVDNTICYAVIGIGINANNAITRIVSKLVACQTNTFHGSITSLKAELDGLDVSAVDLIVSLIEKLEFYYDLLQQGLHDDILAKWKDMSETLNKPILIREQDKVFEAIAEDIDLTGAITVKTSDGNKRKIFSPDNIAWLNNNNNY